MESIHVHIRGGAVNHVVMHIDQERLKGIVDGVVHARIDNVYSLTDFAQAHPDHEDELRGVPKCFFNMPTHAESVLKEGRRRYHAVCKAISDECILRARKKIVEDGNCAAWSWGARYARLADRYARLARGQRVEEATVDCRELATCSTCEDSVGQDYPRIPLSQAISAKAAEDSEHDLAEFLRCDPGSRLLAEAYLT